MTRAQRREQELYVADRPSRRQRPLSPVTQEYVQRPTCPRCDAVATGKPGQWWCGECSVPIMPGRA